MLCNEPWDESSNSSRSLRPYGFRNIFPSNPYPPTPWLRPEITTVSPAELLKWLNDLLQINYDKIEQCGTGGAYCQVMDSIYGDVPMTRVKMDAKHGSESTANYKVLQDVFKAHKVEKLIPFHKLPKCEMQDNLEFLRWLKRFWDVTPQGEGYDPVARRKGAGTNTSTIVSIAPPQKLTGAGGLSSTLKGHVKPTGLRAASSKDESIENAALKQKVNQLTEALEGTEKERDFYFSKLSDIEVLVESKVESLKDEGESDPTLEQIKTILYATEDGFEIAEEADVGDDETF
ncbi:hypothetical protein FRB95_002438 [Tulasnella sp. JGI-2019a]|nr:hypothetical protein FRB95_002438 [Tulasnella sp. JGI-2019a]